MPQWGSGIKEQHYTTSGGFHWKITGGVCTKKLAIAENLGEHTQWITAQSPGFGAV
jgi:hypothetical protein